MDSQGLEAWKIFHGECSIENFIGQNLVGGVRLIAGKISKLNFVVDREDLPPDQCTTDNGGVEFLGDNSATQFGGKVIQNGDRTSRGISFHQSMSLSGNNSGRELIILIFIKDNRHGFSLEVELLLVSESEDGDLDLAQ